MNPRTCNIFVYITNDGGMTSRYSLRPLPPAALKGFVAGFRLCNTTNTKDPMPLYAVCLAADGQTSCDCPAHAKTGKCKHADALMAAGVLPSALIGLLQDRTMALVQAEAALQETKEKLNAVSARAAQLQTALAAIPPRKVRKSRRSPKSLAA